MSRSVLGWLSLWSVCVAVPAARGQEQPPRLLEVRRIWDRAPHNAFTDLIRHQGQWFCVFREGQGHVSPDGALRVIVSSDGRQWESAALLSWEKADLRDAKICHAPDGRLMLCGAAAMHAPSPVKHQSLIWYSRDGRQWSERIAVGEPDYWLWRVTWRGDRAYGFGYGTRSDNRQVRLYASDDGREFEVLAPSAMSEGYPNETSILFDQRGDALCLLRRDGQPNSAQLGTARPPYRQWQWQDLGVRIGGPHMVRLPDGRIFAVVRKYDGGARTAVCRLDPDKPQLVELLKLPSGGDTSYAGIVWHQERLWISYYSSHEGKTAIYLAEVEV